MSTYQLSEKAIAKFWTHIEKTPTCWNWNCSGNFCFYENGKPTQIKPNRVSYDLAYDGIPTNMMVERNCGNDKCVRPTHLVLKTAAECCTKRTYKTPQTYLEKFWDNVEKSDFGCWNWTGFLDKRGSPIIRIGKKIKGKTYQKEYSPRRISVNLSGRYPHPLEQVLPLPCKNRLCVNPDHLVFGNKGRFWAKVAKLDERFDGCWAWTAGDDKDCYGFFAMKENGKITNIRAHVYSLMSHTYNMSEGFPHFKHIYVLHRCDHPWCVRPDHLFFGDNDDNMRDMVEKGRQARGETNGHHKLSEQNVREIKEFHKQGLSNVELGQMYNVVPSAISAINNGKTWKHIK